MAIKRPREDFYDIDAALAYSCPLTLKTSIEVPGCGWMMTSSRTNKSVAQQVAALEASLSHLETGLARDAPAVTTRAVRDLPINSSVTCPAFAALSLASRGLAQLDLPKCYTSALRIVTAEGGAEQVSLARVADGWYYTLALGIADSLREADPSTALEVLRAPFVSYPPRYLRILEVADTDAARARALTVSGVDRDTIFKETLSNEESTVHRNLVSAMRRIRNTTGKRR